MHLGDIMRNKYNTKEIKVGKELKTENKINIQNKNSGSFHGKIETTYNQKKNHLVFPHGMKMLDMIIILPF